LRGDFGELELETPRDRQATFEPKTVAKRQTRWTGFDDKIISMYARGMTTREIQGHLEEMYGIEVSPALISNVTEAVIEEVKLWQGRPLEELYPIVYLDALMVKARDEGHIQNKAIYVVLGVNLEGQKEVLGLWVAQSEGAKFWLQVLTELRNRGVKDIFIACVDGLKGFPEAIEAVYPRTEVQLCIVHLVRASLNYLPWKLRKQAAADLQLTYRAATVAEAEQHLAELESQWKAYPSVSQVWRRNWARVTPFFNYPPDIRRAIYTTNSMESLNRSLRKIIKTRGGFPNEEAALKLLFLALRQAASGKEVDDADSRLARSVEPLHDSLAGTDAGPGAGGVMKRKPFLQSLSGGRGNCPLPSRTHPQRQNLAVYTEELTHLGWRKLKIA
jgi:transposase-like protein